MNEKQIAEKRDETIRRMLNTPPSPHAKSSPKKKKKTTGRKTKAVIALIASGLLTTIPAHADNSSYQSGYDAGYYNGVLPPSNMSTDYGRGVEQGSYDAYQEDQQRSQRYSGDDKDMMQSEIDSLQSISESNKGSSQQ